MLHSRPDSLPRQRFSDHSPWVFPNPTSAVPDDGTGLGDRPRGVCAAADDTEAGRRFRCEQHGGRRGRPAGRRVCADASGGCTPRAAVTGTYALVGADVINVPSGTYVLTIPGTGENAAATGDLDVADDLTLLGAGAETRGHRRQRDRPGAVGHAGLSQRPFAHHHRRLGIGWQWRRSPVCCLRSPLSHQQPRCGAR